MEIGKINRFAQFYESNQVKSVRTSSETPVELNSLTEDELTMIRSEFPGNDGNKLHLYMPDGKSRVEQPGSRGQHIDFKI